MIKKVKPIPEGYHALTPHIVVKGLPKALEYYTKAFGAVTKESCEGPDGKVCHAEIKINDSMLMICEESAEWGAFSPLTVKSAGVSLHFYVENCDQVFERAIKAGAKVSMPVADMFWGDRMGKLVDPFGHVWTVGTHIANPTPAEMKKLMKEAFAAPAAK